MDFYTDAPGLSHNSLDGSSIDAQSLPSHWHQVEFLSRGGMGAVIKAFDVRAQRPIAIKTLFAVTDLDMLRRFEREGQALASLNHPNILKVWELVRIGSRPYLVMELIEGTNLAQLIQDARRLGGLNIEDWSDLLIGVAQALSYCHAHAIVHRDVKAQNVMVEGSGANRRAILADFGLVRATDTREGFETRLTQSHDSLGTPAFMAPEQFGFHGGESAIGPATDVWGFGAMLFEIIAARPPYGSEMAQIISSQSRGAPPRLRELVPEVPAWLDLLVASCLRRPPADRPTMAEVLSALETGFLNSSPPQSPPRSSRLPLILTTLLLGLTLIALAGYAIDAWQRHLQSLAEQRENLQRLQQQVTEKLAAAENAASVSDFSSLQEISRILGSTQVPADDPDWRALRARYKVLQLRSLLDLEKVDEARAVLEEITSLGLVLKSRLRFFQAWIDSFKAELEPESAERIRADLRAGGEPISDPLRLQLARLDLICGEVDGALDILRGFKADFRRRATTQDFERKVLVLAAQQRLPVRLSDLTVDLDSIAEPVLIDHFFAEFKKALKGDTIGEIDAFVQGFTRFPLGTPTRLRASKIFADWIFADPRTIDFLYHFQTETRRERMRQWLHWAMALEPGLTDDLWGVAVSAVVGATQTIGPNQALKAPCLLLADEVALIRPAAPLSWVRWAEAICKHADGLRDTKHFTPELLLARRELARPALDVAEDRMVLDRAILLALCILDSDATAIRVIPAPSEEDCKSAPINGAALFEARGWSLLRVAQANIYADTPPPITAEQRELIQTAQEHFRRSVQLNPIRGQPVVALALAKTWRFLGEQQKFVDVMLETLREQRYNDDHTNALSNWAHDYLSEVGPNPKALELAQDIFERKKQRAVAEFAALLSEASEIITAAVELHEGRREDAKNRLIALGRRREPWFPREVEKYTVLIDQNVPAGQVAKTLSGLAYTLQLRNPPN